MCTKFDKSSIYSARPLFSSRFSGLGHDILTRSIEHQEHSMIGIWKASHATEHSKYCHGRFNWLHPKTLAKLTNRHERKIRE